MLLMTTGKGGKVEWKYVEGNGSIREAEGKYVVDVQFSLCSLQECIAGIRGAIALSIVGASTRLDARGLV